MNPVKSHEAFIGALVVWMHAPRGGYGYSCPVPARIVALNPPGDRAIILARKRDGSEVRRSVHVASLRWREGIPPNAPAHGSGAKETSNGQ